MLKLVFLCTVSFVMVNSNECSDKNDTRLEDIRFQAVVYCPSSKWVYAGILITEHYVISSAADVYDYESFNTTVIVSLGVLTSGLQVIPSTDIVVHEQFQKLADKIYINNIALIKLSRMAKLTDNVRPGKLISKEKNRLLEGKHATINGWLQTINDDILLHDTIIIQHQDVCSNLFGDAFIRSQEFCYKYDSDRGVVGDVVRFENKIVGFLIIRPPCSVYTLDCTETSKLLSFAPFLDWISNKTNVPIEQFTIRGEECDVTKIEESTNETNYENINKLTSRLQEELNDVKTKVASELAAQNARSCEAKFIQMSKDLEVKVNKQIEKLQEEIRQQENVTKSMQIKENYFHLNQAEQMELLLNRVFDGKQENRLKLNKHVAYLDNAIKNISDVQNNLHKEIQHIQVLLMEGLATMQKEILRLDVIQNLVAAQRNEMEKYVIQIQSLNNTVNKIRERIDDEIPSE